MLVLGKLFQPNLMFVGEVMSLPYSEASERFIWVGSSLTRKYYRRLEKLAKDKRSRLIRNFVKSFIRLTPGVT